MEQFSWNSILAFMSHYGWNVQRLSKKYMLYFCFLNQNAWKKGSLIFRQNLEILPIVALAVLSFWFWSNQKVKLAAFVSGIPVEKLINVCPKGCHMYCKPLLKRFMKPAIQQQIIYSLSICVSFYFVFFWLLVISIRLSTPWKALKTIITPINTAISLWYKENVFW